MDSFVYKWIDSFTGMMYIGVHKGTLDDGYVCSSKYMLEEYNKRPKDFSREILEYGDYNSCRQKEHEILESSNASENPLYYNRWNGGKYFCISHSEETKSKISAALKGKPKTESFKIKMKKSQSKDHIQKRAAIQTGKKHSEESKLKMSLSSKGIIPWNKGLTLGPGRKHTEETKEKIRLSRSGVKRGPYKLGAYIPL